MSNGEPTREEEAQQLLAILKREQDVPPDGKGLMASVGELADALVEELPPEEAVGALRALLGVRRVIRGAPGGPPEAEASAQTAASPQQAPKAPEPPKPASEPPKPASAAPKPSTSHSRGRR